MPHINDCRRGEFSGIIPILVKPRGLDWVALWGDGGGSLTGVRARTTVRQVRHLSWAQTLRECQKLSNQNKHSDVEKPTINKMPKF